MVPPQQITLTYETENKNKILLLWPSLTCTKSASQNLVEANVELSPKNKLSQILTLVELTKITTSQFKYSSISACLEVFLYNSSCLKQACRLKHDRDIQTVLNTLDILDTDAFLTAGANANFLSRGQYSQQNLAQKIALSNQIITPAKIVEILSETQKIGASELAEEEKTTVKQSLTSVEEAATAKIRT